MYKQLKSLNMRKYLNLLTVSLFICLFFFFTNSLTAQTEAPPPPQTHGVGGDIPGGGAPVGEGLILLMAMGAAYGAKKAYHSRKKLAE
jgi:hypothetical protein